MSKRTTRRIFIQQAAIATTGVWLAGCGKRPTTVSAPGARALSPGSKLNIGGIGVGGKGWSDITETSQGHNVVAICDVQGGKSLRKGGLEMAAAQWPQAERYSDWRRLLERKDIDCVTVSTPDHMHAPIAVAAMQLGKHVFVQKPMAHSVYEARQMALAARKYKVVTQMGNQHHNGLGYRALVEIVRAGGIGKIREAHAWSNRPIWPQGIERPGGGDPVPADLQWDLWLGVAPERPFKADTYHPFKWRGWFDFGAGALGDMGCHIMDPVVWSLELGPPSSVRSENPPTNGETFPTWSVIRYVFPGTRFTKNKTIAVTWRDGGKLPPAELAPLGEGEKLPDNGTLLIGEGGALLTPHGGLPALLPAEKFRDYKQPELEERNHYRQWTNAILGKDRATSSFDYAGPLTETVLLGNVAIRFPNETLEWDSRALRFANSSAASRYLRRDYRRGWEVGDLSY